MLVTRYCPDLIHDVELLFHFSLKVQRCQHYLVGAQNSIQALLNKNIKINLPFKIRV